MYLRTKYDVTAKLESFYDGGPVAVSSNGELVACVHNGGIKVSLVNLSIKVGPYHFFRIKDKVKRFVCRLFRHLHPKFC